MTLSRSKDSPHRDYQRDWPRSDRATVSPPWAIAMLGIAATALSSFACSPQGPAQPPASGQTAAKAPVVSRTVSVAPDDAETRTPLFLLRTGNEGGNEVKGTPVVALGRPVGGKNKADTKGTIQGILERELVRQALLIAARDELGLPTRDQILEESSPAPAKDNASASPVEVAILFRPAECRCACPPRRRRKGDNPGEARPRYQPGCGKLYRQADRHDRDAVAHRVPRASEAARCDR